MRLDLSLLVTALLASTALGAPLQSEDDTTLTKRATRQCTKTYTRTSPYTGPNPTTDSPSAFLNFATFTSKSTSVVTPSNFTRVWNSLHASLIPISGTDGDPAPVALATYSPKACAQLCRAQGSSCKGFNLYYQRLPKTDTTSINSTCAIPNASLTTVYCQVYTQIFPNPTLLASSNTTGFKRNGYTSVISGSNGYVNSAPCDPSTVGSDSSIYTGPIPADNPTAFLNFSEFANKSKNAVTPTNYTRVFVNQHAKANITIETLMSMYTYDVESCAGYCSRDKRCKAFNVYYSRVPGTTESNRDDLYCKLPNTTITDVRCDTSQTPITILSTDPKDISGWTQNGVEYVYTGSNAYNKK